MRIIQCDRCHTRLAESSFKGSTAVEISAGPEGELVRGFPHKDLCEGCSIDLVKEIEDFLEPLPIAGLR